MSLCLPCTRIRLAGRSEQSRTCSCAVINEDLRARVYKRAAEAVREDRAKAAATWRAPDVGAPVKWGTVTGLKVRA